jgi:hypothetical protein
VVPVSSQPSPASNNHAQRPYQAPLPSLEGCGPNQEHPSKLKCTNPATPTPFHRDVGHFFVLDEGIGRNTKGTQEGNSPATHATSGCVEPKPCTIGCNDVGGPALGKSIAAYGATTRYGMPHSEHGNHVEMRGQHHYPEEGLGIPDQNNHPTDAWNADVDDTTIRA